MNNKSFLFISAIAFLSLLSFRISGYLPGDKAVEFNLLGTDDQFHKLADLAGKKGCIVVFTCNHCPFAKAYEQRIIDLDKKYRAKGFPVIAINPNDTAQYREDNLDSMKYLATLHGYPFSYLWDETQATARAYGAEKTPHVFLLEKKGVDFFVRYTGAIDNNYKDAAAASEKYLENALDALLNGKEISVKTTKAVGCGVKWKP